MRLQLGQILGIKEENDVCPNETLQTSSREMTYSRRKADSVITDLERPINAHLLKLLCVEGADALHWRRETVNWLDEVAQIRLKATSRPAQASFYFRVLFEEPFGGVEERNVSSRINRLTREGYTLSAALNLAVVVATLRKFHWAFSNRCASGLLTDEEIKRVVDVLAGERDD